MSLVRSRASHQATSAEWHFEDASQPDGALYTSVAFVWDGRMNGAFFILPDQFAKNVKR